MSATDRPRVFVHLDHGRSLEIWRKAVRERRVLESTPYGYEYAADLVDLTFSRDRREGAVLRFVRRGMTYVIGFDLVHALQNRHRMRGADMIWTHTEHEHLAISLLMKLGIVPTVPMISQSIWLWDEWAETPLWKRAAIRWLMNGPIVATVHSRLNAPNVARALGIEGVVVPFGIDPVLRLDPHPPLVSGEIVRVVAPGNDRHRDWQLLAEVARHDPSLAVEVLTRRDLSHVTDRPANFRVSESRTVDEYAGDLADASVVVVPLKPNDHASGITVAMEAVVAHRAVVVTGTGGLEDYLGDAVEYAEPGDVAGFAAAIHRAAAKDAAALERSSARIREAGITAVDFALRHVVITRDVLAGRPIGEAASAFRPVSPALSDEVRREDPHDRSA